MKSIHLVLVMLLVVSTITMMSNIYAEEENEDDESSVPLGSSTGNIILYGTIAAIIASIGYTALKIVSSKRKPSTIK